MKRFPLQALVVHMVMAFGAVAQAAPTGGAVSVGSASIATGGSTTTITQSSHNVAIHWQSFNIGATEAVRFVQPSSNSVALNRVLGSDPSTILGSLTANGQVFLVNPSGILFGKGASVNVGGLVASTLNLTDSDFMAGRYKFANPGDPGNGSVLNKGAIHADGGTVALLGARVSNEGTISAKLGTVALAAGNAMTLDVVGDGLLSVTVDRGALNALVDNRGLIQAAGGNVLLSAQSAAGLFSAVVNNTGVIEAGSISDRGGIVRLTADTVHVSGTLDVSGKAGGGQIEIGGGWQGGGSLPHATAVTLEAGTTLNANAVDSGDGGTISVWSDGATRVAGTLKARGGAKGGHGGNIETSGHELNVTGIAVDAAAPLGAAGQWLLDPYNMTISAGATTAGTESPAGTWTGASIVNNATINSALNSGTSVVLQTGGTFGDGLGSGNITVSSPIAKTSGAPTSLTLKAGGSVIVSAGTGISSSAGALDVTLNANTLGGGGYVSVAAPISTLGGSLVIGGGATPSTGDAVGTSVQGSGVSIAASLSTGVPGQAQVVGFVDTGTVTANRKALNAESNRRTLSGAGIGVIWSDPANFLLRAYWAHTLGSAKATSGPDESNRFWIQAVKFF